MIPVWDVQTFYGTHQKTFQKKYNAEKYFNQLSCGYDRDLIEIHRRELTTEEFNLTDVED